MAIGTFFSGGVQTYGASVFSPFQGGTGTSSPSGILYGSNSGSTALKSVVMGTGISFAAGVLSSTATGATITATSSPWVTGESVYVRADGAMSSVATGTVSAGSSAITVTAGRRVIGGALSIDCATSGAGQNGCLSSADWTTFNNKGSGSVTSINFGNALTGGTITTSGNVNLKAYFATSTADTSGQVTYWNSTNAWPALFTSSANFTFNGFVATMLSASTTNLSVNGTNIVGTSTPSTSTIAATGAFVLPYATSTTWTGTSSATKMAADYVTLPFDILLTNSVCSDDVGTLHADPMVGVTHVQPYITGIAAVPATTTFTTNNALKKGATFSVVYGTPASSPTSASCTFFYVRQGI